MARRSIMNNPNQVNEPVELTYFHHHTVNTGHSRPSRRAELKEVVIDHLCQLVRLGGGPLFRDVSFRIGEGGHGYRIFNLRFRDIPVIWCGCSWVASSDEAAWSIFRDGYVTPYLQFAMPPPRRIQKPGFPWLSAFIAYSPELYSDAEAEA